MNIEDYIEIGIRDGMEDEDILENLYTMGLIEAGCDDFGQPYAYDNEMYDLLYKMRGEQLTCVVYTNMLPMNVDFPV